MLNAALPLIQVGFHGCAVVMLYFGYKLLRKLVEQQIAQPQNDNFDRLKMLLREVRVFIAFSLLFFLAGATLQLVNNLMDNAQKNKIYISLDPSEMPYDVDMPAIRTEEEIIQLEDGHVSLKVGENQTVIIKIGDLTQKIRQFQNLSNKLAAGRDEDNEMGIDDEI